MIKSNEVLRTGMAAISREIGQFGDSRLRRQPEVCGSLSRPVSVQRDRPAEPWGSLLRRARQVDGHGPALAHGCPCHARAGGTADKSAGIGSFPGSTRAVRGPLGARRTPVVPGLPNLPQGAKEMDRLELVRSLQTSVARLVLAASEEPDPKLRDEMSASARQLQTLLDALFRRKAEKTNVPRGRRTSATR